jgi:hypothetical protein
MILITPKPKKKRKRKATPAPTLPPEPAYKQAVYRLSIFSAYCIWWDATIDQWSNDGCVVCLNIYGNHSNGQHIRVS